MRYARPGHIFGLRSALSGFEYSLSVEAINDCRTLVWYGEVLAQLMERYSRIAFNGMRIMTLRNVEMQLRYQELLTEPVEQRVPPRPCCASPTTWGRTPKRASSSTCRSREDLAGTAAPRSTASAVSCASGKRRRRANRPRARAGVQPRLAARHRLRPELSGGGTSPRIPHPSFLAASSTTRLIAIRCRAAAPPANARRAVCPRAKNTPPGACYAARNSDRSSTGAGAWLGSASRSRRPAQVGMSARRDFERNVYYG